MGFLRRLRRNVPRPPRRTNKDVIDTLDDDRIYGFEDDRGRPLFQGLRLKGRDWKLFHRPFTPKTP